MPTFRGYTATDTITSKRQVIDMSEQIAMLNAKETPFTLILKKISKSSSHNYKFEWMQDYLLDKDAQNTVAIAVADTTLTLSDVSFLKPNDVISFKDAGSGAFSDIMLIKSVNVGANQIDVVRGIGALNLEGGTPPQAVTVNSDLAVLGNAFDEGGVSAVIISAQESSFYNYTQFFRTSFGATGRADKTKLYGGKITDWERKKKGITHAKEMELAFLFGERSKFQDPNTNNLVTTTQGLWKFLTNIHSTSNGGVLDEANWDAFIELLFTDNLDEGSNTKTVFCGSQVISAIQGFAKPYMRLQPVPTTYGIDVMSYVSPFGKVNLVYHPKVFNLPLYANRAIGVDFRSLKYRFLEGRDTKLFTNIQENDRDAEKDEYRTDAGLQVTTPEVNAGLIID